MKSRERQTDEWGISIKKRRCLCWNETAIEEEEQQDPTKLKPQDN